METRNYIPSPQTHPARFRPKVVVGPRQPAPQELKVHKDGDIVHAIEIHCACGEIHFVELNYE